MTIETQTIAVLTARLPEAWKELGKLVKKAKRYGNPDITLERGEQFHVEETIEDWDGTPRKVRVSYTNLLISGEAPRVGSHEFLARVEFTAAGNLLCVRPGVEDLEHRFRETDGHCDHCKSDRQRKEVFVVRDLETGEQLQVGRSCLRDYMGIDNPAHVAQRFAFYKAVRDGESDWGAGIGMCWSLLGLLKMASVAIRAFGWCSKTIARDRDDLTPTTAFMTLGLANPSQMNKHDRETYIKLMEVLKDGNGRDEEIARKALSWVRHDMTGSSDYEHNLRVVTADDYTADSRHFGLIASVIPAYLRAQGEEFELQGKRKEPELPSEHIGAEGERMRGLKVTKIDGRVVGGGRFGDCLLIKFRTEEGNILTWFTGAGSGMHDGDRAIIDATVKRHTEFRGKKETQVSRVSVKEVLPAE